MNYPQPTAYLLAKRLFDLGAIETHPNDAPALSAAEARNAINDYLASEAVCGRYTVDGKPKLMRFREVWAAVYGEKWVFEKRVEIA